MVEFRVSGMTCGGCAASVTRAIKSDFPSATIDVNVAEQTVKVDGADDAAGVARLIEGAGFPVLQKNTL